MFFDFFALAVFQNNSKKFWRLTENPENIFPGVREISGNFFRENLYTHSPAKQNCLQLANNLNITLINPFSPT